MIIGIIIGMVLASLLIVVVMPKLMIVTYKSNYDFDTTVKKIEENIKKSPGWNHKNTDFLHQEIERNTSYNLGKRIAGIKLCHGNYAFNILQKEKNRFVTAIMPCNIAVWEGDDNNTYISEMNIPLMGRLFGGDISKIMVKGVAPEEKRMLEEVIKK